MRKQKNEGNNDFLFREYGILAGICQRLAASEVLRQGRGGILDSSGGRPKSYMMLN
jgi:hypothetical protein